MKFYFLPLKSLTKILTLCLLVPLSLWNCQKDDEQKPLEQETKKSQIKFVSEHDIPEIINFLEHNTSFNAKGLTNITLNAKTVR